jgi:hypothetical protein
MGEATPLGALLSLGAYVGPELGFEVLLQFGHDGLNLFVGERLFFVLKDEADGIGFHALGDAFDLIDIEEADALEEFFLGGVGHTLDVGKLYFLVDDECQVAAYLGELGYLGIQYLLGGVAFEDEFPVDVGIEDFLLAIHPFEGFFGEAAEGAEEFVAVAEDKVEAFGIVMFLGGDEVEARDVDTHAA